MTVAFVDVGRDRKNWQMEAGFLSDRELTKELRRRRALSCRVVKFCWNEVQDQAAIYAGTRHVGTVKITGGCKLP